MFPCTLFLMQIGGISVEDLIALGVVIIILQRGEICIVNIRQPCAAYAAVLILVAVFRYRAAVYYNDIRSEDIVCLFISVFFHDLCYRSTFVLVDLAPEGLYSVSDNITSVLYYGKFH